MANFALWSEDKICLLDHRQNITTDKSDHPLECVWPISGNTPEGNWLCPASISCQQLLSPWLYLVKFGLLRARVCYYYCYAFICKTTPLCAKDIVPWSHLLTVDLTVFLPLVSQESLSLSKRGGIYMFHLGLNIQQSLFLYTSAKCRALGRSPSIRRFSGEYWEIH